MRIKNGFTLLELSIVLVVIALLTGAVLGGQTLLRNARLRSVSGDAQTYAAAIRNFRDKYKALPGDFSGATALWGAVVPAINCEAYSTAVLPQSSPSPTCDGNGSGGIDTNYEMMAAWQHLSNAGMVNGRYSGASVDGQSDRHAKIGLNTPASALEGGGFNVYTAPYGASWLYSNTAGLTIFYGRQIDSNNVDANQPIMTTAEAYQMDQKLDDGIPGTGIYRTPFSAGASNCNTAASASSNPGASQYNLGYGENFACSILLMLDSSQ